MKRNPWIVAAVVCFLAVGSAFAEAEIHRSFSFRPGDTLEIETERGDIEYHSVGGAELTLTIRAKNGDVEDYLDLEFDDRDGVRIKGVSTGKGFSFLSSLFGGGGDGGSIQFVINGPEHVDLIFSTSGGDIVIIDDIDGSVTLATSGGDIAVNDIDGSVTLTTSGGDITFSDIRGSLKAGTSGGNILGASVSGASSLATSGGDIRLQRADADLKVGTSGGDIELGEVGGWLKARTSGGGIEVMRARGDVKVSTSGGDIVLEEMEGFVEARSSGGRMEIEFAPGNHHGGDLSASGGDLNVRLPRGVGFDLDADADGGEVRAVLPVETEGRRDGHRLRGTIAGGGNLLKLRNNNGDIVITDG